MTIEEERYFVDQKGQLHKRGYGLNIASDPGPCKVSNDVLVERVDPANLRKYVGAKRCDECFPKKD